MIFALMCSLSVAAPVRDGLQARILPPGYDFVAGELSGTTWPFGPTQVVGTWECYDTLTVDDLNLSVELEHVALSPVDGGMAIAVDLGRVRGENMQLSGTSGWLDLCIDFDTTLEYIELENGTLTGMLAAKVEDRAVALYFPEPVVLDGELSSEVAWFPDDLAWLFMESTVLDMAGSLIEDELPPVVSELTAGGIALSTFGDVVVDLSAREVAAGAAGLFAAVDVDLGGDGGVGAHLNLGPRGGSHMAVGLPAALAEEVLQAAWIRGLFAADSPLLAPLVQELLGTLDLQDDVDVFIGLAAPPSVAVDEGGVYLRLTGVKLAVTSAGGDVLLSLLADAQGVLDVRLVSGAIVLSVHDLELEIRELEADRLLEGDPDHLQAFLQGWVVDVAARALRDLVLWESHFEALGYVLRLDEREPQSGGLVVWATLFAADDPQVDREPPDTVAQIDGGPVDPVHVAWSGVDDRPGVLLFRHRVDGGSWSGWTEDAGATLAVAEPGAHVVEVVARDGWFNEDPSPAVVSFTVAAPEPDPPASGCGCANGGGGGGGLVLAGLLAALSTRRDRSSSRRARRRGSDC